MPRLGYRTEKSIRIRLCECAADPCDPLVLAYKVQRAQHGTVADLRAKRRQLRDYLLRRQSAQHPLTEVLRDRTHLCGDGGILVAEIGMAAAGIRYTHAQSEPVKIRAELRYLRIVFVGKIERNKPADRTDRLIHQSARLTEIIALRAL